MKQFIKREPLELESIRKRQVKPKGAGITYNVAKCKGGYGVYVKAISGLGLIALRHKFPDIEVNLDDETSQDYGKVTLSGQDFSGGLRVNSNRIAKYSTEKECQQYIAILLGKEPMEQWQKVNKFRIWQIDKDRVLLKMQYYQFYTNMFGKEYKLLTSQDKAAIKELAVEYHIQGQVSRLHPTVARTKSVHPSQVADICAVADVKPAIPTGLKGMTKAVKDLGTNGFDSCGIAGGGEFCRRITQRRKRTTTLSFYNKYR